MANVFVLQGGQLTLRVLAEHGERLGSLGTGVGSTDQTGLLTVTSTQ